MQNKNNLSILGSIWSFVYPLLIYIGVEIAVEIIFSIVCTVYYTANGITNLDEITKKIQDLALYITSVRNVALIPILLLLMWYDRKKEKLRGEYIQYIPLNYRYFIILPFAGFFAALGFNHVVPMALELLQTLNSSLFNADVDFFSTYENVSEVTYSGSLALQVLAAVILAPLVEELLLRGLMYRRLRKVLGSVNTNICTALMFGLIHGNAVQFVYAFLIGLILGYVYEKFKTVLAPIILHVGANLISVIVTAIMDGKNFGVDIGTYMIVVVIELAVTFLLLKIIDMRVERNINEN